MALASKATMLGLASFILLTAGGGAMNQFRLLLFLHAGLLLLYLGIIGRGIRRERRRWGRIAVDSFPLMVLPLLFWSHRYVWFPLRLYGCEVIFDLGDRLLRGRFLVEAAVQIQAGGGWGSTWLFWLIPAGGFYMVGFLVWSRAARDSFLAWRDGVVIGFYLGCLAALVLPLRGPAMGETSESASRIVEILSSISAWDGRSPVSMISVVLWSGWKSSRGKSLFLSKFFLVFAAATTVVVAFSPSHYALSAFLSPAVGLAGSALANQIRRRDAEAQRNPS